MRIPADVERPDRLLANLTARQLAILGVAGVVLWATYTATRHVVPAAVFLASGGPANLGIASTGGLVDLLVSACLCWVLVKIPTWVGRMVFSGSRRSHGGTGRMVRDVIVYKGIKALAAGVGL